MVYTSVHVDELIMDGDRIRGVVGAAVDPKTHERKYPVRISAAVHDPRGGRDRHPGGDAALRADRAKPWGTS